MIGIYIIAGFLFTMSALVVGASVTVIGVRTAGVRRARLAGLEHVRVAKELLADTLWSVVPQLVLVGVAVTIGVLCLASAHP